MFRLLIISSLFLYSCGSSENNKNIIGKWHGIEWLVNNMPSDKKGEATIFVFSENGKYTFDYNGNLQQGTYKVENDMLFTTPDKQQEIMVKINKLANDTLVFEMNRGGVPELLTLVKTKNE